MYELSFVKKYLSPKKKQLSVSLIALMSIGVIALVVWLVLLFLSVTEGIERTWLKKLTALNAPLKIQPTEKYFSSYSYLIDQFSSATSYSARSIGEKMRGLASASYDPETDPALPERMPPLDRDQTGSPIDPVGRVSSVLAQLQKKEQGLAYQPFEISGALLRLSLIRQQQTGDTEAQLTQVAFLASFAEENPRLMDLILPPTADDINQLFFAAQRAPDLWNVIDSHISVEAIRPFGSYLRLPPALLPEGVAFAADFSSGKLVVPATHSDKLGSVVRTKEGWIYNGKPLPFTTALLVEGFFEWDARLTLAHTFSVHGQLQGVAISGEIPQQGVVISRAAAKTAFDSSPSVLPLWPYAVKGKPVLPQGGVLLAKNLQESGVKMGDEGYLSYSAPTASAIQEQRLPVRVAGFYDPGILAVGSKCILVASPLAEMINASQSAYSLERTSASGIQVWFPDFNQAFAIKEEIQRALKEQEIDGYCKVVTYHDYDFAKDLMQQFASDKMLFTLIGLIILIVACCNIISLLIILVSDKKKEIGILQAMGASKRSIALIFGLAGGAVGLISSLLGALFAYVTLKNIDILVQLLSFVQGHQAFNTLFFGKSLPHDLSTSALTFVLIATPLIALVAGLIPASKACRISPAETLKAP